jgi:uncharacterized protein YndB with AHSA1/START domain
MENKRYPSGDTSDREIVLSRVFDAPRELVFEVWTKAAHVAQWWGPNGFTNTVHEMDVRPGGIWRLTMHGPDGTDYPNLIRYYEVVPPEKLVYNHSSGEPDDPGFHVTILFETEGAMTRVTMHSIFVTKEVRDMVVQKYHAIEGGKQTLARMEEYLKKIGA